ncbi:MAG: c-type cytochrome [Proteobacteria bacterium]|nr:c-type cytochrome [Pseudomonadota bacterium]
MFGNHSPRSTVALLALVAALGLGAGAATTSLAAEENLASIVRGGRLYDNWYQMMVGGRAPTQPHPAYPRDKKFANDPASNWRCVECHGWDYRGKDGAYGSGDHYTGIKGIRGMAGADPAKIVAVLTDGTHQYGGVMDGRDLRDLANFVSKGQLDMDTYIDRASRKSKGDGAKHEAYYSAICANCHGRDGLGVRSIPPLGTFASENPWASLHKVLNGHPSERMPPLRALGLDVLVDVLAFIQTLPKEELLASMDRGGRLYDNWYVELGAAAPTRPHPAYPRDRRFARDAAANWRCVECHGWDYRGKDGAYGSGDHYTGIKGIRGMAGADPEKIITILKNETHDFRGLKPYRAYLDEHDLRDLANFVSKGQVEVDRYIDRATGQSKGDGVKHEAYYNSICATCHGRDGLGVRSMPPLARVARDNPWQTLHKMVNGHPSKKMPALRLLDMSILVDVLAFVQTLPTEEALASIVRGGRLYDNWYREIRVPAPTRAHPAYPRDKVYAREASANWRCVECHGWDYRGRDGVYGKGEHYTGIRGVRGLAGAAPDKVVAVLRDENHGFDTVMDAHDLRDLANFVAKGQVDMTNFVNPANQLSKGDKTKHKEYYDTICAKCHNEDGRGMRAVMPPLGAVAKADPWAALHKMLNGHPDEGMPALRVLDPQILTDVLAYIQSLPAE